MRVQKADAPQRRVFVFSAQVGLAALRERAAATELRARRVVQAQQPRAVRAERRVDVPAILDEQRGEETCATIERMREGRARARDESDGGEKKTSPTATTKEVDESDRGVEKKSPAPPPGRRCPRDKQRS